MKTFLIGTLVCAVSLTAAINSRAAQEELFPSPDDAVQALKTAAKNKDTNALNEIFGPELHSLMSADAVQASNRFALFANRIAARTSLEHPSDDKVVLNIGYDNWPFPIPIVKHGSQWAFDTGAGKEEILNRRIGGDELATLRVCNAYVDAQREYASEDRDGDGVMQYAQLLRSTPGKHDGLYWHAASGEELSPLGPLIAAAKGEGYVHQSKIMSDDQKPYHGYFFKILTRQGKHAAGGKYNYVIHGRMIAGFALVAWPAQWGNSGFMTFIVNQDGKIYEKCLGEKTANIASKMTTFDPESSWRVVEEDVP
jgi:hypothetical protein